MAAGLEDWVDFGVICGLLLLNAAVGFVQEYQAGSIVDELKKTLALKAVVLRDGTLKEIEAPEVVPGDILQIEEVSLQYSGPMGMLPFFASSGAATRFPRSIMTNFALGYHHPR